MTWFHWSSHTKCFCFYLDVSNSCHTRAEEPLECCGLRNSIIPSFGNFTTIEGLIGNKDPIQLTFISICCFELGTTIGLFGTNSSCYLQDSRLKASHLKSYLIFSLASYPQCMNDDFLTLQHNLNSCHPWQCLTLKISLFLYQYIDFFIIKGFWTIVFIFIVISTMFWLICSPAFFRCLLNLGTFTELQTTSFIESIGGGSLFWFR